MSRKENVNNLRGLSAAELDQKKSAFEKDLFDLRQKKGLGQLDKPHQFRLIRKQVAQIETIKREKKNVK